LHGKKERKWRIQLKVKCYSASSRFYGELRDLLKKDIINIENSVRYTFDNHPSVKDAIECMGPPHTEVSAILVDSKPKNFDYWLQDQDNIEVYSFDTIPDLSSQLLLPNKPKGELKFVLDVHLGGLARYLRFFGIDTLHDNVDPGDKTLVNISSQSCRILLTRDIGLLKHAIIRYGYWLRNTQSEKQFLEIAYRYGLGNNLKPFSRCSVCNGLIGEVEKVALKSRISSSLYSQFDEFWECGNCNKIYWKGKHYYAIKKQLDDLTNQLSM